MSTETEGTFEVEDAILYTKTWTVCNGQVNMWMK
jgi:hypothetical protein